MENSTKTRILNEALAMFAEKGYQGAHLRELAARLNLSKSALYKHFDSKEAIWQGMLDQMEAYYAAHFSAEHRQKAPMSRQELYEMTMAMIHFTVHDPRIILSRKLLLTQQFHDERVRQLATRHFLEGTAERFTGIFAGMMAAGRMKKGDPALLALAYTAPITSLIHLCDREPHRRPEALQKMEAMIEYFMETHGIL